MKPNMSLQVKWHLLQWKVYGRHDFVLTWSWKASFLSLLGRLAVGFSVLLFAHIYKSTYPHIKVDIGVQTREDSVRQWNITNAFQAYRFVKPVLVFLILRMCSAIFPGWLFCRLNKLVVQHFLIICRGYIWLLMTITLWTEII